MTYRTILYSSDGGVARLTLNRPDRLNSFTVEMHEEVADALSRLEGARVLVLTGAGRRSDAGTRPNQEDDPRKLGSQPRRGARPAARFDARARVQRRLPGRRRRLHGEAQAQFHRAVAVVPAKAGTPGGEEDGAFHPP